MSGMILLEATGICKSYGDIEVLKGIDLEVREAEVVSVVGASGAGKSTMLYVLGSLDRPDRGTVEMDGRDLHTLPPAALARFRNSRIGFVFQFHNLLPEFTALENVCIPGYIGRRPAREVEARARELLGWLGLSERLHHKPARLSGGEQQRTAVARALINNPALVFADEPSGNLDSHNAEELHRLFFDLRSEFNTSFVIVTHNPALAAMADRQLTIEDGRIIN